MYRHSVYGIAVNNLQTLNKYVYNQWFGRGSYRQSAILSTTCLSLGVPLAVLQPHRLMQTPHPIGKWFIACDGILCIGSLVHVQLSGCILVNYILLNDIHTLHLRAASALGSNDPGVQWFSFRYLHAMTHSKGIVGQRGRETQCKR